MLELELQGVRETAVEDLALRLKGDLFADIFGYASGRNLGRCIRGYGR